MSAVLKAVGSYMTGKEDARALRRQGDVASNQGLADEEATRRDSRQFLGRQAAAFAQSGVGPGGTADYIVSQSDALSELDALNIRYKGLATRSERYGEAKLAKVRGKREAATQLLSGFEKAASGGAG